MIIERHKNFTKICEFKTGTEVSEDVTVSEIHGKTGTAFKKAKQLQSSR